MYYLTRSKPTDKWLPTLSKGNETLPDTFETFQDARAHAKHLNAEIDKLRKAQTAPVGRPSLPEQAKAKRVFFTLRPEVWQAISPQGDAKELKTFAKEAINEKLKREDKK